MVRVLEYKVTRIRILKGSLVLGHCSERNLFYRTKKSRVLKVLFTNFLESNFERAFIFTNVSEILRWLRKIRAIIGLRQQIGLIICHVQGTMWTNT